MVINVFDNFRGNVPFNKSQVHNNQSPLFLYNISNIEIYQRGNLPFF